MNKIKENHSFNVGDTFIAFKKYNRKIVSRSSIDNKHRIYKIYYEETQRTVSMSKESVLALFKVGDYSDYIPVKNTTKLYPIF